jgi:hypothetical protein
MALAALSGDAQCMIFSQLRNVLDTRVAVAFSSASSELRAVTLAPRQQLRADYEAATALCLKIGLRSCKELREAKTVRCFRKGLSVDDLATLGTLSSVLPAVESLILTEPTAGPDGVQRLVEKLGAGALLAVTFFKSQRHALGRRRRLGARCRPGPRRPAAAQDPLAGQHRHR